MNSGKKSLISHRVSSRKTPETASVAKHGLRKHLTVLLPILFRAALAISFLPHVDFDYDFLSRCGRSSFNCTCLYTATEPSELLTERKHLRYLTMKGKLQSRIFLRKHELI